mmetsp:Transcript_26650/g.54691  ORF Transcript_26650/g.54691 Transcript_26650/m.54691 type:complete len:238 (+) Transcript_26650:143-856(+)
MDDDYEPFGEGVDRDPSIFHKPEVIHRGDSSSTNFLFSVVAAWTAVFSVLAAWYATIYITRGIIFIVNKVSCCGSDIMSDFNGFDTKSYISRISRKVGAASIRSKYSSSSSSWGVILSDIMYSESSDTRTDDSHSRVTLPVSSGSDDVEKLHRRSSTGRKNDESTNYSYSSSSTDADSTSYRTEEGTSDSYRSVDSSEARSNISVKSASSASDTSTYGYHSTCSGFDAGSESSTVKR